MFEQKVFHMACLNLSLETEGTSWGNQNVQMKKTERFGALSFPLIRAMSYHLFSNHISRIL